MTHSFTKEFNLQTPADALPVAPLAIDKNHDMARLRFVNQYASQLPAMKHFYEYVIGLQNTAPSESWHGYGDTNVEFALEPASNRDHNVAEYDANWGNAYLLQFLVADANEMNGIIQRATTAGTKVLAAMESTEYGILTKLVDPEGNFVELLIEPTN